jgi:phosphoribosylamine--glycine ligase
LDQLTVDWHDGHAVCVVMTSEGYPGAYDAGEVIHGLDDGNFDGAIVFHAGTAQNGQSIVTAGGRVLGISGRGRSLAEAQAAAYRAAKQITFKGCHYRRDIAYRAFAPHA